jgi:hypothetical protein
MDTTAYLKITGIGSLPFVDVKEGIDIALKHDIPFIPQLPNLEGSMIDQIKNKKYIALESWGRDHQVYKIQLVGPQSSGIGPNKIIDFAKKLKIKLHQTPILFIDEPIFESIDMDFYDKLSKEFKIGIHCCGNTNWDELLKLPISYISFDTSKYHQDFPYQKFISKKIKIVLGIIPTDIIEYDIDTIYEEYKDFIKANYSHLWLSPACGLGQHTPDHAYKVFNDLVELQKRFRTDLSS